MPVLQEIESQICVFSVRELLRCGSGMPFLPKRSLIWVMATSEIIGRCLVDMHGYNEMIAEARLPILNSPTELTMQSPGTHIALFDAEIDVAFLEPGPLRPNVLGTSRYSKPCSLNGLSRACLVMGMERTSILGTHHFGTLYFHTFSRSTARMQ